MTKILAITQARYGSSRLPGKILRKIKGKSLLEIHLERLSRSKKISKIKVATTTEPEASLITGIAAALGIDAYRGSVDDVLERFYFAALPEKPDYVVRLTSDCPLIDPVEVDKVITTCIDKKCDYASNTIEPTFPDGIDVEVFTFSALEIAYREATLKSDREHVTPYIWRNSSEKGGLLFTSESVKNDRDFSKYRVTVDTEEDFILMYKIIMEIGTEMTWMEYVSYLDAHPDIFQINSNEERNEGYQKSLNNDKITS